jgi:ring-1,2-phenylacetyl-CoA epoxidase subunit PaaE
MSVAKFHALQVKDVRKETADCVSVAFKVPESLASAFTFQAGQYLTLRHTIDGAEVRRSYSICSGAADKELRVAIKQVPAGKFSTYANHILKEGDVLDVMTPMGKFTPKKDASGGKHYLLIASGSGITPIISILKTVLQQDAQSTVTLLYGNKSKSSIIFREDIEAMKNNYMQRLSVMHVLSREQMEAELFNGRIGADKCKALAMHKLIDIAQTDEAFICGPEAMILEVKDTLLDLGMDGNKVHVELFSSPEQPNVKHEKWVAEHASDATQTSKVSITLDGNTFEMDLAYNGDTILDAALKMGADLPFACKGGVCCTCRARVMEGKIDMELNYALEKDEVEKGFVLTCQSHPRSERVVIDFDER